MEKKSRRNVCQDLSDQLDHIANAGLWRELFPSSLSVGARIERNGRVLWNFCSNNYLDLATHPHVVAHATEALQRYGSGAGGSRLITGALLLHEELEERLAAFKSTESALVFSSGYLANLGVIQVLSRRADDSRVPIVFDKLVHASLIDAILATGAPWKSFVHNDVEAAAHVLEKITEKYPRRGASGPRALVVTEGVFSMDGDVAPVAELYQLAEAHEAYLVVDDAHGTGVVGERGAGVASLAGIAGAPLLVQIGTLSKALGSQGGFVACSRALRQLLVNRARAFIFDTALAPPCAAAALAAFDVIEREPERLRNLLRNAELLRARLLNYGLSVDASPSAIIPLIIGDAQRSVEMARKLEERGHLCVAIRPPTVPPGTARLRMTVMASHPTEAIEELADVIAQTLGEDSLPTK